MALPRGKSVPLAMAAALLVSRSNLAEATSQRTTGAESIASGPFACDTRESATTAPQLLREEIA